MADDEPSAVCECLGLTRRHNEIDNNELAKVEKYTLNVECQKPDNVDDFERMLREFAQKVVNRADYGENERVVFYKANIYKRMTNNDLNHHYTFHFFLYSGRLWDATIHTNVNQMLQDKPKKENDIPNVPTSYVVQELLHDIARDPLANQDDEGEQGWDQIPGNCCEKFLKWWLIIPSVQLKFFGLLYQMYTFDIFHQGFFPKFVHFFTIPTNVMLSMCFLAQYSFFGITEGYGAFTMNAGLALMIILVIFYMIAGFIANSAPWGLATSVVIFVCWVTGNLWYTVYKTPANPWYNPTTWPTNPIIWSYGMSFIQALSHVATGALPPYITGYQHWESFHVFFCKKQRDSDKKCTSICFIVMSLIAFPVFSVAVAWFSWPHLIGTEVIYTMAGIGYQPEFFKKFHIILEKADSTGDPGITQFPSHPKNLTNPKYQPFVDNLVAHNLLHENPTPAEILECASTCNMLSKYKYFHHGNQHVGTDCISHYDMISKGLQKLPRGNPSPV